MKTKSKKMEKMTLIRSAMMLSHRFYGYLAGQIDYIDATDQGITDTMATDGRNVYFHIPFLEEITKDRIDAGVTVLIHEIEHIARDHCRRRGSRDQKVFNLACDYAINNDLDNMGFIWPKHPDGTNMAYINHEYDGKSAEEIYEILMKENGGKGPNLGEPVPGRFSGGMGDVIDSPSQHGAEAEAAKAQLKARLYQAAKFSQAHGSLPGHIQRKMDAIANQKVPWTHLTRRFVTEKARNDYSWQKPNKALLAATRLYLPSLDGERMGKVVAIADTSGSVSDDRVAEFGTECKGIWDECKPEEMWILDCDTDVNNDYQLRDGAPFPKLNFTGGGGTDFRPPFQWLQKRGIRPACLIYFTDMYGEFPRVRPPFPVLWISYSSISKAPFGEVVLVD